MERHGIKVWHNARGWYSRCDTCQEQSRACGTEQAARAIAQMHVDGKLGVKADARRRRGGS